MFELTAAKMLFRFQQTPVPSPQKVQKVSKADVTRITQYFESQQILHLPACLTLASKVLCKALFKSDTLSKLKKLEKANREINRALDIRQLLRAQQMTRLLSECLLSAQSLRLAQRATATCALNESESNEESLALDKLEGWQPKSRVDQVMLQRFMHREESEQHQQTRQHLHTETHFKAAFEAENPIE